MRLDEVQRCGSAASFGESFGGLTSAMGRWNRHSTEAWSPLKEDLPHPSWAKTIFNERLWPKFMARGNPPATPTMEGIPLDGLLVKVYL